ncbi:MAG: type II toxin-antitoxin system prevent-host-death family antitoxin [Patescibacteria group bacterium]
MNGNFLSKILRFAKENGERVIVVSESGEEAFAIIPFAEYEKLAEATLFDARKAPLTERPGLDTIPREIAEVLRQEPIAPLPRVEEDWGGNELANGGGEQYHMEPLE